jgi:hypothetical protein
MSKRGKFAPYVVVDWRDSHTSAKIGWRSFSEVDEYHALPAVCTSVGLMVKRDKKGITLAMSTTDEGLVSNLWHIPAGMVLRVRRLRKS